MPLVADQKTGPSFRRNKIVDWPNAISFYEFEPEELDALSEDPPLYFFTLFEAAHDKSGERLGVLGSTIVAEVMFSALHSTQPIIEDDPQVQQATEEIFGTNIPKTMPDLLNFIKENGGLKDVNCPMP